MKFWGFPQRLIFQNPQTGRSSSRTSRNDLEIETTGNSPSVRNNNDKPEEQHLEQIAETNERDKMKLSSDSIKKRADVGIEARTTQTQDLSKETAEELARSRRYNPETMRILGDIDIEKPSVAQKDAWNTLLLTLTVSVAAIVHERRGKTDFIKESPASYVPDLYRRYLTPEEALASGIVANIMEHPESPLYKTLQKDWREIVPMAQDISPVIRQLENMVDTGKSLDSPPKNFQKESKVSRFMREHTKLIKWSIRLGMATAGFFAAKWILGKLFSRGGKDKKNEKVKDDEKDGFFGKILKWTGIAAGASLVGILGSYSFGWMNKDSLKDKVLDFIRPDMPDYRAIASKINIDPDKLGRVVREKYKTFMEYSPKLPLPKGVIGAIKTINNPLRQAVISTAKAINIGKQKTKFGKIVIPGINKEIPQSGLTVAEVQGIQIYLKLITEKSEVKKAFGQKNLNIGHADTTIGDVLAVLNDLAKNNKLPTISEEEIKATAVAQGGVLGALFESKNKNSENPDNDPENDIAVQTPGGEIIGVAQNTYNEIKTNFLFNAPILRRFFEKWENKEHGLGSIVLSPFEFAKGFIEAVSNEENKLSMIIESGRIILTNGTKYIVVTQIKTVVDTFRDVYKVMINEKEGNVLQTAFNAWTKGTLPFIVGGALLGATGVIRFGDKFGIAKHNFVTGGLKGAARGLIFPVYATYKEYRLGKWVMRTAREGNWTFKRFLNGPAIERMIAYERINYYSQRWMLADSVIDTNQNPIMSKRITGKLRMHLGATDWWNDRDKFGKLITREYKRYIKLNEDLGGKPIPAVVEWGETKGQGDINKFKQFLNDHIVEKYRKEGKVISFEEACRIQGLPVDTTGRLKLLTRAWSGLKSVLGPLAAAATIFHMEHAEDKKKAFAEITLGHLGFFSAAAATQRSMMNAKGILKNLLKHPRAAGIVLAMSGIAGAFGLSNEKLGATKILDEYILSFSGAHGAAKEAGNVVQKMEGRYLTRVGISGTRHGIKKLGFQGLEKVLQKQICGIFLKKIQKMAQRKGILHILKMMGWRGAAMGFMLADDATVIGVLDDVIALGFGVWMAKDIIELIQTVKKAQEVDKQMSERINNRIETVKVCWPKNAKDRWEQEREKLLASGDQEKIFAFFRSFPKIKIRIMREGSTDSETWSMRHGEVTRLTLRTKEGVEIASVTDKDAGRVERNSLPQESKEEKEKREEIEQQMKIARQNSRNTKRQSPREVPANRET